MPVGPSHSRHNSSRSSGGSSRSYSGGSSRSYSSSSYRPSHRSYSSSYYHSGSYYYGTGVSINISPRAWAIIGLIFGFIFAAIFLIVGGSVFSQNIGSSSLMRRDAKEYYEIIEMAKSGKEGYYLITIDNIRSSGSSTYGEFPTEYSFSGSHNCYIEAFSEVRKSGVNYYYLIYSFTDDQGRKISGETYSCYSESALLGLSDITFVYTKEYDGDGSWDVMPTNYNLKNNMDYWNVNKTVWIGVLVFAIGGGAVVLFVYLAKKLAKKNRKESKTTDNRQVQKQTADYKICDYCGCQHSLKDRVCSSCGSRKFTTPKVD